MANYEQWSKEEDAVLLKHYRELGPTETAKLIPTRNLGAVRRRAQRLRIRTPHKNCQTRAFITRVDQDWQKLLEEMPEDTRTPGQKLMGDPVYERSAPYKKQMGV